MFKASPCPENRVRYTFTDPFGDARALPGRGWTFWGIPSRSMVDTA